MMQLYYKLLLLLLFVLVRMMMSEKLYNLYRKMKEGRKAEIRVVKDAPGSELLMARTVYMHIH